MKRLIIAASLMLTSPAWADALDDSAKETNHLASQHDSKQVNDALASQYSKLAGSKDNASALTTALRNGTAATLTSKDGSKVEVKGSEKTMGWGGVNNTLALAQGLLQKQGISNPTTSQLAAAIQSITSSRSEGLGWGEIAHDLGLNMGKVESASRATNRSIEGLAHHSSEKQSEREHGVEAKHQEGVETHRSGDASEHSGQSQDSGKSTGKTGSKGGEGGGGSGGGSSGGSSGKGGGGGEGGKGGGKGGGHS